MVTLAELCGEIRNYFDRARYFGTFRIQSGKIDLSELVTDGSLQTGQYFRIVGSIFNDGVYEHPEYGLRDETFNGAVWTMAVPPEVLDLLESINEWVDKNGSAALNPYSSESFGGYSYTMAGTSSASGDSADSGTWQNAFANRLNRWRKVSAV